jgi:hypothetical protein
MHPPTLDEFGIPMGYLGLDGNRALERVQHAWKLG